MKYEVIIEDSRTEWRFKGLFHREDGPACVYAYGEKHWYQNGKFHREDGPAVIYANGAKYWYKNGERHRIDGPAYEGSNGTKEWWIEDVQYTEAEFVNKLNFCEGKIVEIEGRKYKLTEVS